MSLNPRLEAKIKCCHPIKAQTGGNEFINQSISRYSLFIEAESLMQYSRDVLDRFLQKIIKLSEESNSQSGTSTMYT